MSKKIKRIKQILIQLDSNQLLDLLEKAIQQIGSADQYYLELIIQELDNRNLNSIQAENYEQLFEKMSVCINNAVEKTEKNSFMLELDNLTKLPILEKRNSFWMKLLNFSGIAMIFFAIISIFSAPLNLFSYILLLQSILFFGIAKILRELSFRKE